MSCFKVDEITVLIFKNGEISESFESNLTLTFFVGLKLLPCDSVSFCLFFFLFLVIQEVSFQDTQNDYTSGIPNVDKTSSQEQAPKLGVCSLFG